MSQQNFTTLSLFKINEMIHFANAENRVVNNKDKNKSKALIYVEIARSFKIFTLKVNCLRSKILL